jgi:hypothetical protein
MSRIRAVGLLIIISLSIANVSYAFRPIQPPVGGCYNCTGFGSVAECEPAGGPSENLWQDCQGGSICYYDPSAGQVCVPFCGNSRCFQI